MFSIISFTEFFRKKFALIFCFKISISFFFNFINYLKYFFFNFSSIFFFKLKVKNFPLKTHKKILYIKSCIEENQFSSLTRIRAGNQLIYVLQVRQSAAGNCLKMHLSCRRNQHASQLCIDKKLWLKIFKWKLF